MLKPHPVGIAWYAREDYGRILAIMSDAELMPDTFDDWLERAAAVEDQLRARGFRLLRVPLRPDVFLGWCQASGVPADAEARCQYAAEAADREALDNPPIRVDLRRA